MVRIEAVIQPSTLESVKETLDSLGLQVTVSEVLDLGGSRGQRTFYRGVEYRTATPKVKLEMLASTERGEEIVDALLRSARTFSAEDDGTIVVYEVADAIRIHTGARLQYTLA